MLTILVNISFHYLIVMKVSRVKENMMYKILILFMVRIFDYNKRIVESNLITLVDLTSGLCKKNQENHACSKKSK